MDLDLPEPLAYQVHDDFTVGMSLEGSGVLETLPESDMVVDLSVDGEDDTSVFVDQRLSTSVCGVSVCTRAGSAH